MSHLISVVVPVYNVEAYLTQCIESLTFQTYADLEIILIDDGSTDSSGLICDEYAKKDERIFAVHQKNAGAAAARNTGLNIATGEYLAFADSDDWLEPDAYTYMVGELKKEEADIIQCSYRNIYVNRKRECICKASGNSFDQVSYLARFTEDWTCSLLWDKLFRRDLFSNVRFETGHIVDDEFFTYQGVMKAKKIICRDKIIYNYRRRISGATGNPQHYERIVNDKLDYLTKRLDKVSAEYPLLKKVFSRHFLDMMSWLSEENDMTEYTLSSVQTVLRDRWKQCRNSGESLRTDLKLLKLMHMEPQKYLSKRRCLANNKSDSEQLFT